MCTSSRTAISRSVLPRQSSSLFSHSYFCLFYCTFFLGIILLRRKKRLTRIYTTRVRRKFLPLCQFQMKTVLFLLRLPQKSLMRKRLRVRPRLPDCSFFGKILD